MLEIDFELEGLQDVIKAWEYSHEAIKKTLPDLNPIIGESILTNYIHEGRPRWEDRTYDYEWPILWKSGDKQAIELASARAAFYWDGNEFVLNIISTSYGGYHQYGTARLPARKSVRLTRAERQKCQDALIDGFINIRKRLKKRG